MCNDNFNVNNLPQTTNGNNPFEIFDYKNLGSVRVRIDSTGKAWFCLVDVCNILNHSNPSKLIKRLHQDGITLIQVTDSLGRLQNTTFVDQGNLYKAIGRSSKPEAQNFMDWVYREVLPNISNYGGYMLDLNRMTNDQISKLTPYQMIGALAFSIDGINHRLDDISNTVTTHGAQIAGINEHINMIEKTAYASISDIARFKGIPMTLENAQKLGSIATKICSERGIDISSKPHDVYNYIHTYPIFILEEVFSTYLGC